MRGHVRSRGKGSWAIVVELPRDQTGKRRQQWHTIRGTKREAETKLREILHSLETGSYVEPAKVTVADFLEQWIEGYVKTNTGPRTRERYIEIVRIHLIPALGSISLVALKPQHIQSYYGKALESGRRDGRGGLSAQTVHHHHRVLFQALKYGVKHGVLVRNVAEAVDPPRPEHREITTLGPEAVGYLVQAAHRSPYYTLFFTALYTGLRRSELLGLRWEYVNLDLAVLSVVETLHQLRDGTYVSRQTKSKKGRRLVDMSPSLCSVLREQRAQQKGNKLLLGLELKECDFVFSQPDGKPIRPDTVTRAFGALVKSIGMAGVRFHDLRHTHATLMLSQGVHPKIVSERLGHSSVAITLDTYSHVLPGLQKAAALRFEEGLQSHLSELPVGVGR